MSEQEEQLRLYAKEAVAKEAAAKQKFDEVTNGLGRVCMEFQKLESVLKWAISELMSKDDPMIGSMITAELSFDRLVDLLYAAWEYRWKGPVSVSQDRAAVAKTDFDAVTETKIAGLKKILNRCNQVKDARNRLVHSEWYLDQKDVEGAMRAKMTCRASKGFRIQNQIITPMKCRRSLMNYRAVGANSRNSFMTILRS